MSILSACKTLLFKWLSWSYSTPLHSLNSDILAELLCDREHSEWKCIINPSCASFHSSAYMFVPFNGRIDLNRFWKEGSLLPGTSNFDFILKYLSLHTSTTGSIAAVLTSPVPSSTFSFFCLLNYLLFLLKEYCMLPLNLAKIQMVIFVGYTLTLAYSPQKWMMFISPWCAPLRIFFMLIFAWITLLFESIFRLSFKMQMKCQSYRGNSGYLREYCQQSYCHHEWWRILTQTWRACLTKQS